MLSFCHVGPKEQAQVATEPKAHLPTEASQQPTCPFLRTSSSNSALPGTILISSQFRNFIYESLPKSDLKGRVSSHLPGSHLAAWFPGSASSLQNSHCRIPRHLAKGITSFSLFFKCLRISFSSSSSQAAKVHGLCLCLQIVSVPQMGHSQ